MSLTGITVGLVTNSSLEQRPISKEIGVYGLQAAEYIFKNWPDKIVHCADIKTNGVLGIARNLQEAEDLFKGKKGGKKKGN